MGRVIRRYSSDGGPSYEARYVDEHGKERSVGWGIFTSQYATKKAAERAVERAESKAAKRRDKDSR
jgi:hypothetical protein